MALDWSKALAEHLSLDATATTTYGALLASIGRGVQAAIERRIGRDLEPVDHVEGYNGRGLEALFLRWDPVISLASVAVQGEALTVGRADEPVYPPPQVVIASDAMILRTDGMPFPSGPGSVIVTYTAGFAIVPPDLFEAAVLWGALIFKNRDRAGISSQSMGAQSVTFSDEPPKFSRGVIDSWQRTAGRS